MAHTPITSENLRFVALYSCNHNPMHIVRAAYGVVQDCEDGPGGYLAEKAAVLDKRGFLWWMTTLDDASQANVARDIERYAGRTRWRTWIENYGLPRGE